MNMSVVSQQTAKLPDLALDSAKNKGLRSRHYIQKGGEEEQQWGLVYGQRRREAMAQQFTGRVHGKGMRNRRMCLEGKGGAVLWQAEDTPRMGQSN